MIELISSLFEVGDIITIEYGNPINSICGKIIKILSSSIALKLDNESIVGIKGDEIISFNSNPDSFSEISKDSSSDTKEEVTEGTQRIEEENGDLKGNDLEQDHSELTSNREKQPFTESQYKAGDVIPLAVLEKIDPKIKKKKSLSNNDQQIEQEPLLDAQNQLDGDQTANEKKKQSKEKKKAKIVGNSFEALAPLVQEHHELENLKIVPAIGTVIKVWEDRRFGFLHNSKTGHDTYFSFNDIIDGITPRVGQGLVFTEVENAQGYKAVCIHRPGNVNDFLKMVEKYITDGNNRFALDIVNQILFQYPENFDAEKLLQELKSKVSYTKNTKKQTFVNDLYQKAKLLHESKKYIEAIEAYKEAIKANHRRESAVKDLGMLYLFLCNQADTEEKKENFRLDAIEFMEDTSKYLSHNIVTWSYLENFYYSVREFEKFDFIIDKLLANSQVQSDGQRYVFLLNKKAASYLRRGNKKNAKIFIDKSLKVYPEGSAALKLLSIIDNEHVDIETVFNASEFETLTSGLSMFIQDTLDQYEEYHGVPSKIIESGKFSSVTLNEIRTLIETAGKARARERAKYLLTEGKLMQILEPNNISRLRSVMARFCNAMAQNHIFEQSSLDIIRFFYLEAFSLEEKFEATRRQLAIYLLTHIYDYNRLLNASSQRNPSLDDALKIFLMGDVDMRKWESVLSVFLYNREISAALTSRLYANPNYLKKAQVALQKFGIKLQETQSKDNFVSAWNQIREQRIRDYKLSVSSILSYRKISSLEELCVFISYNLREERKDWMFALDLSRITSIINNIAPALDNYLKSSGFRNKEAGYNNARGQISQLIDEIEERPTRFSYEAIRPLMSYISDLLENSFNEVIKTSEPRVYVRLLSEETVVDDDNLVTLQVSVSNHKDSSPIKEISVEILDDAGVKFIPNGEIYYNAIEGGESSIFKVRIKVSDAVINNKATAINILCKYTSGKNLREQESQVTLKLYSQEDYKPIDNPYAPIADGGPVPINSSMFFGREEFISDIVYAITNAPSKQIIIYGQKRCGKSSVMLHLKEKLENTGKNLCIFFSLGDIIQNLTEVSFYHKILSSIIDEFEEKEFNGEVVPKIHFPNIADFEKEDPGNPLNTFTKYMRRFKRACKQTEGWEDKNLVVMVDEFTYLYTEIKKGHISPSIMKQWKAVTQNEKAQFSVVLVGQDVVPSFKKEDYARNAFGVIEDIRLTYLNEKPARELIEKPILDESGESRYIGNAVSRIIEYTSRNPYYIQIFCARLVDYMNRNKSIKVTEADVNEVAKSFMVGEQALEEDKFDNLIRAGETEDLQEYPESEILAILRQIAIGSKNVGYCCIDDINILDDKNREQEIIKHLIDREVLEQKGKNNYRIQVKLFQEWLLNH